MTNHAMELFVNVALSGLTVGVAKTVTAPLERVQIILQTQDAHAAVRSGSIPRYSGIRSTLHRLVQEKGMASLWRGNLVNVLRYIPSTLFKLAYVDTTQYLFPKYNPKSESLQYLAVSFMRGLIITSGALVWEYPLIYAHTKLASNLGTKPSLSQLFSSTVAGPSGVRGLYGGYMPAVLHQAQQVYLFPYLAVETSKLATSRLISSPTTLHGQPDQQVQRLLQFCITQLCLGGYIAASYPLDTVSSRMRMMADRPLEERLYNGAWNCAKHIVRNEGLLGFYKGVIARLLSSGACGFSIFAYSTLKDKLF